MYSKASFTSFYTHLSTLVCLNIHSFTQSQLKLRAPSLLALLGEVAGREQVLGFYAEEYVRIFNLRITTLKTRLIGGTSDFGGTVGELPRQIVGQRVGLRVEAAYVVKIVGGEEIVAEFQAQAPAVGEVVGDADARHHE